MVDDINKNAADDLGVYLSPKATAGSRSSTSYLEAENGFSVLY